MKRTELRKFIIRVAAMICEKENTRIVDPRRISYLLSTIGLDVRTCVIANILKKYGAEKVGEMYKVDMDKVRRIAWGGRERIPITLLSKELRRIYEEI